MAEKIDPAALLECVKDVWEEESKCLHRPPTLRELVAIVGVSPPLVLKATRSLRLDLTDGRKARHERTE
jgi:hypothetical protein